MTDEEYKNYMLKHYVENDEHRLKICKDLNITESQMYKRNKKLGITRPNKLFVSNENKVKTKKYKYDFMKKKWIKQ